MLVSVTPEQLPIAPLGRDTSCWLLWRTEQGIRRKGEQLCPQLLGRSRSSGGAAGEQQEQGC